MNAVIAVMPVMPRPTPKSAVRTGSPAATSGSEGQDEDEERDAMPISSDLPPISGIAGGPGPVGLHRAGPGRGTRPSCPSSDSIVVGLTSATVSTSKSQVIVPTRPSSRQRRDRGRVGVGLVARSLPDSPRASDELRRCRSAAASTGLAGAVGAPSGIWGAPTRSSTRASTSAWCTRGPRACWPSGAATTTLTEAWSNASGAPGEELGLEVGCAFSEGMPGIENASLIGLEIGAGDRDDPDHGDQPGRR